MEISTLPSESCESPGVREEEVKRRPVVGDLCSAFTGKRKFVPSIGLKV